MNNTVNPSPLASPGKPLPLWQRIEFERLPDPSWQRRAIATLLSLVASLIVCGSLIALAGANLGEATVAMLGGALGSQRALLETLVKATPLILTALAATVAFRGRIWNIGAEGQLLAGAIASYWAYTVFDSLPPALLAPTVILAGFTGGALLGTLAAVLKVRFAVDEILSTMMLNYIMSYLLSFLLSASGPWREPSSFYQQTALLPDPVHWLTFFPRSRLHPGFLMAIAAAILLYILLQKTTLGYHIRAIGFNPQASQFKGIPVAKTWIMALLLSGGIAGLAGVGELFGTVHRLNLELSSGYGYTGIIIACLGNLNPLAIIAAALFFAGLTSGAFRLQVVTGVPSAIAYVIQAVTLLFFLVAQGLAQYRIKIHPR